MNAIITNFSWITYHLCFLAFYILDNLRNLEKEFTLTATKYVGFVAIVTILLGGFSDIIECLVKFLITIYRLFLFIYKRLRKLNNKEKEPELEELSDRSKEVNGAQDLYGTKK